MRDDSQRTGERRAESTDRLTTSRRGALSLLGVAGLGVAAGNASARRGRDDRDERDGHGNEKGRRWNRDVDANGHGLYNLSALDVDHVYTPARAADVIVWKDESGVFHADGRDEEVASGENMIAVIQAAVDSLSADRTSNETVLVTSPGTVGQEEEFPIELPSYTTLDVPVDIHIEGEPDEESAVVVRATDAESIRIPHLNVSGYPNFSVWIQSCTNVRLGDITIRHADDSKSNTVVRIDDFGETGRTTDVQVDRIYVKEGGHHAFETYSVDRIEVDQVIGDNPDGCVVLLNDTTDATVNSVVGREPGVPAGYATFRVANGSHDVTVGEVVSRGGARGVFGVTECYDITVGEVNVVGARDNGILIQDCQNFTVDGGVVKNSGEAVRVDTRDSDDVKPAEGVSVSNLRILDDREEPAQAYGIHETGPRTNHNRFVNNDLRGAGTEANVSIFSETTVVRDNVGAGVADGVTTLVSGASPAARVEGVSEMERSALDARIEPATTGSEATYAWDHWFEWDGAAGHWNLVFEWRTDPGTDVDVDYVVDKTR